MSIFNDLPFTEFVILLLASLVLAAGVLFERIETETKCPKCGRLLAAERLGERIKGIFRTNERSPLPGKGYPPITLDKMVEYEKYEAYYRCKYCSHEWTALKTRKL